MGYEMSVRRQQFTMEAGQDAAALEALRRAFPESCAEADCFEQAMEDLGWEVYLLGGRVVEIRCEDKRYREDEKIFATIAPFVAEGSYIEMEGEDGERWRWAFGGGRLYEHQGVIAWGRPREIAPPQESV